ncbi:response regulator [Crateriforma conspicua]|uniref:Hydrogenase transcriptional regulatory protein hupR1 n=1 Tax=Crateriforma conspicua TaxID=2527996 RepID=A0A5C6FXP1_9PLAN|nr:response regulator [Crateriforma conspicua]TWU66100.1 Hydrogenase transcriptional regulatory protein hupR1 [Crateriforma conspicua]
MNDRVLFVDDEQKMLDAVARRFEGTFEIHTASSGAMALQMMEHQDPFGVVICDMRMPQMDGLQLIKEARKKFPDSIYMMLTGNQDLTTACNAVNVGQVFRLLHKPCHSSVLHRAIEDGLMQYDLLNGREDLLRRTFGGALTVLTEILELTHPIVFQRSHTVMRFVDELADQMGLGKPWDYRVAASLANIGRVVVGEHDQDRSDTYGVCIDSEAEIAGRLIANIPRLTDVAEIVRRHPNASRIPDHPEQSRETRIEAGALLLRTAIVYEFHLRSGLKPDRALTQLTHAIPGLAKSVLDAAARLDVSEFSAPDDERPDVEIRPYALKEGMILAQNVQTRDGSLLLSKGTRLSQAFIERLQQMAIRDDLRPLFVQAIVETPDAQEASEDSEPNAADESQGQSDGDTDVGANADHVAADSFSVADEPVAAPI